ncbi:Heat shock factor protein 2 [Fulvia fulva]|uniref:Heat shock factor protein 2 n=1 Tax=Passalora fulva TaxID=5499 RepID=A0A9Q8LJ90_PASFU|nr:Heat shock factor protein 2 [Fulvia fulva]KAK4621716.1 Heat shock factor protein 2 [Fulvia fulva]KAK4622498.1 Heat shock factor protein 2 [Fulvia fulva]UJO18500.1 Heat shock factor protein 2 [Fulvia fulva]WPV15948.1 Heat shock factor protein 2 [Fulvia fulva]WPV30689.1 Heat shock factor protein 2 [Fulvia fulva]
MQQSVPTRKRQPPGASPTVQQPMTPTPQYPYQHQISDTTDFNPNFDFPNFPTDQSHVDSVIDTNNYSTALNTQQPQTYGNNIPQAPSTDLVRRNPNQQLAAPPIAQQEQWNGDFSNMAAQDESEQELEAKVARAKMGDAHGKRKQIPPFVQKLSSFLDKEHESLIRWSDDGRAFIVLDEDEFARRLIPELFKHNNYASFVRQLNMYGFHKTVNIHDGSLRQSEQARKGAKPPSMYSHPYFRRNRPDLLWLIQKPASKSSAKRKRDGNMKDGFDSDDERQGSPFPDRPQELRAPSGNQDVAPLPRSELSAVRQELKKLQQQQGMISRMISQLKDQNDQFYRQASAFQTLHDRHENSINAILTFLATFYNRSVEGNAGQNLVNMFGNQNNQNDQQRSGVVQDLDDSTPSQSEQVQQYRQKPQLLLTHGGEDQTSSQFLQPGSAVTAPNSARPSISPPEGNTPLAAPPQRASTASVAPSEAETMARAAASPAIKNDAPTPDYLNSVPENNEVMSYIHNANAKDETEKSGNLSFPAGLEQLQNAVGNAALTPQQRSDMMSMMQNRHGNDPSSNNALISPQPAADPSHYMEAIRQNNISLNDLESQQQSMGRRLSDLQGRLAPLSPGGIPGISNDYGFGEPSTYNLNSDPYDMNDFVNLEGICDYAATGGNDNADIDFLNNDQNWNWDTNGNGAGVGADMFQSTDAGNGGNGGLGTAPGTVESLSSEATSPAATNQFAEAEDDTGMLEPGTPNKRQRKS